MSVEENLKEEIDNLKKKIEEKLKKKIENLKKQIDGNRTKYLDNMGRYIVEENNLLQDQIKHRKLFLRAGKVTKKSMRLYPTCHM
jgi:F0F1-type ATP synthase membrane subunit b/b'